MGLFCLSRHLRLLFRSQSRSGGVERVRGYSVVMCVPTLYVLFNVAV